MEFSRQESTGVGCYFLLHGGGPQFSLTGVHKKRKFGHTQRATRQGKGHVKTQWEASRLPATEQPQEKPNLQTPGSWTSGLWSCKKINVCCLSCTDCGIWLRRPQQTNTRGRPNRNIYIFYKSYRFCPICWISFTLFLQLHYSQKVVLFLGVKFHLFQVSLMC